LQVLAGGCDSNEIAAELSISPRAVEEHVSSILSKLRVSQRVDPAISVLGPEMPKEESVSPSTGTGHTRTAAAS
jgi:DNA-binding NarL/FixJ family response regulator